MLKKILIISFIFFFLITLILMVMAAPFVTYWAIINNKHQFEFYKVEDPARMSLLLAQGENLVFPELKKNDFDQRFWKTFHVENYKIPLPIAHPLYVVGPVINEEDYKDFVQLGMRYLDHTQKLLAEVQFNESKKFQKFLNSQQLFTLPLIKNLLESHQVADVWRDLFLKDLSKTKLKEIIALPLEEMVYNLYILHMRMQYFPANMISFFFYERLNAGGMKLDWEVTENQKEAVIFMVDGILESYTLYTRNDDPAAKTLREKLIDAIFFFPSFVDETRLLYDQFRDLPYQAKISQEGMLYLFAAWSHSQHDKEFMREIIGNLERGEGNFNQLNSLYAYALKHYGKQFSGKREKSADQQGQQNLEQKIEQEQLEEITKEKNERISEATGEEEGFENMESKMKYFLQKAKEKKKTEESSKVLIFD